MQKSSHKRIISLAIIVTAFMAVSTQFAFAQKIADSEGIYSSSAPLPYAKLTYSKNEVKKQEWKIVGPAQKYISATGYIKKPYHNPNLIEEKEQQRQQEAERKAMLAKQQEQQRQQELQQMAQNAAMLRRKQRGFHYFGPVYVSSRQVSSRQVVPFSEYKKAAIDYYKNNRNIQSIND